MFQSGKQQDRNYTLSNLLGIVHHFSFGKKKEKDLFIEDSLVVVVFKVFCIMVFNMVCLLFLLLFMVPIEQSIERADERTTEGTNERTGKRTKKRISQRANERSNERASERRNDGTSYINKLIYIKDCMRICMMMNE